ncbi:MAG: hypothetical protein ACJAUL_002949, partial [Paraglaciecola sp.]
PNSAWLGRYSMIKATSGNSGLSKVAISVTVTAIGDNNCQGLRIPGAV